jgi:hypothetical protein
VHIAFGFHVNLHHSYRGDLPDRDGFGSDIDVIRSILDALDRSNIEGIPVRGTWDFDNLFSLEQRLPRYAPDIIARLKRRVAAGLDEVILMSYNNGLVSCMTPSEFRQSIGRAITNAQSSGILDIFGSYAPIVRPQEMMFSPSSIRLYKALGIEALCLYYSGAPVDGFRTLVPLLSEGQAFNPMRFEHQDASMTIIPAISHADLIDYGGLRALARRLHHGQACGEIESDVLVFINTDADSFAWKGFELPIPLKHLPLSGGLSGLIRAVSDLPYVVFDTPHHYLQHHPTQAAISFGHDIADGAFDGYASWSEKPVNHLLWSRVERIRMGESMADTLIKKTRDPVLAQTAQAALEQVKTAKLTLLSTTFYGLASPHLNLERETEAMARSAQTLSQLSDLQQSLMADCWPGQPPLSHDQQPADDDRQLISLVLPEGAAGQVYCQFELAFSPGCLFDCQQLSIQDDRQTVVDFAILAKDHHPDDSIASADVFLFLTDQACSRYQLVLGQRGAQALEEEKDSTRSRLVLSEDHLAGESILVICDGPKLAEIWLDGRKIGGSDLFRHYLRYRRGILIRDYEFAITGKTQIRGSGTRTLAGYRFEAKLDLPGQLAAGHLCFDLFILEGMKALFIRFDVQYPLTPEQDGHVDEVSNLGRPYDSQWIEVAPCQINLDLPSHAVVIKRNLLDEFGQYELRSFAAVDVKNKHLDAFNHQVTAGLVGFGTGSWGMLLATARNRLSAPAFCPMRLKTGRKSLILRANPFGTYAGQHRHHQTYAGALSQVLLPLVSAHLQSLAPAYNGVRTNGMLALFTFAGESPDPEDLANAQSFSDGLNVILVPNDLVKIRQEDSVDLPVHLAEQHAETLAYRSMARRVPARLVAQIVRRFLVARFKPWS